jgi:hypothetical protein
MSWPVLVNNRQPVDFIKADHCQTVESLRKLELTYMLKRDNIYEQMAFSYDKSSERNKQWYREDQAKLAIYDDVLMRLYLILRYYYNYPDEYFEILNCNKEEWLPIKEGAIRY